MCTKPGKLPNGQEIACRKCWQCLETKIDDWVGRCLAEAETASATFSVTLTYGRDENGNIDHMRAAVLTYSDVQKMFYRLRTDGYKFKYLCAGEYGSEKGRAHWHLVMFFDGKVPPHQLSRRNRAKRFENKYWPHGFQHWEEPSRESIRYVCKYVNKEQGKEEKQGMLRMAKKPPIGSEYFARLAEKHVEHGLAPTKRTYEIGGREYYLSGATLRNYLDHYEKTWAEKRGGHYPQSDLLEAFNDAKAKGHVDPEWVPTKKAMGLAPIEGAEEVLLRKGADGREYATCDARGYRWWYELHEGEMTWRKGERLPESHPYWRQRRELELATAVEQAPQAEALLRWSAKLGSHANDSGEPSVTIASPEETALMRKRAQN